MEKAKVKSILFIITYAVLLFFAVYKWPHLKALVFAILGLIMPFLMGACLAFILSIPMNFIENCFFRSSRFVFLQKWKRPISLLLTICFVLCILWFVMGLLVPEIGKTAEKIVNSIPQYAKNLQKLLDENSHILSVVQTYFEEMNIQDLQESVTKYVRNTFPQVFTSTVNVLSAVVQGVFNFLVCIIFAIYLLFAKEKLGIQCKKLLYAFLPVKAADRFIEISILTHKIFSNFLTGQCLEAVILGAMFFVAMSLFRMPYALLIGVVIAVTALIPIFGAFIGCFLGAFLILMIDPMQAFMFLLLFLALQQIEGNIIYPKVVGGSVGLPSIWVLMAVTIGGNVMGVAGMLIFIPLASVLYALIKNAAHERLTNRGIKEEKWRKNT